MWQKLGLTELLNLSFHKLGQTRNVRMQTWTIGLDEVELS